MSFYQGNYLSQSCTGECFPLWVSLSRRQQETSDSLLLIAAIKACLPAPTRRLPAERAPLINAGELEVSHGASSRGRSAGTRLSPLLDVQSGTVVIAVLIKMREKEQMCTLRRKWLLPAVAAAPARRTV